MGDRANICIEYKQDKKKPKHIFFYGHWSGEEMPSILQRAIAKRWRWDDESYLARIIFCELVKGHEKDETGFGIAPFMPDNEHPCLVVDTAKKQVRIHEVNEDPKTYARTLGATFAIWTFDEFAALDKPTWETVKAGGGVADVVESLTLKT